MPPRTHVTRWLAFLLLLGGEAGTAVAAGDDAIAPAPPAVQATRAAPRALAPDEPITVVIHSAEDCPICKAWRGSSSGLPVAQRLPKDWPHLQVVIVERKSLYGSEAESLYPVELQYLYQARRERYQLSPPVPMFEIVRQGQVISRHVGLQGWTDGTLPEVEQLEAGRTPATTDAARTATGK
jgi:hypothetical protein